MERALEQKRESHTRSLNASDGLVNGGIGLAGIGLLITTNSTPTGDVWGFLQVLGLVALGMSLAAGLRILVLRRRRQLKLDTADEENFRSRRRQWGLHVPPEEKRTVDELDAAYKTHIEEAKELEGHKLLYGQFILAATGLLLHGIGTSREPLLWLVKELTAVAVWALM